MQNKRENWGSRLGVILAVAGSAVGLGNFLVFPGRVVGNGGGAFLIPYFIAFVLIGIPLAWIEWSMGRMGGRHGHGSGPGVLNAVIKKPYAKYLGSLGVVGPLLIFFLYVFLESWILGYLWYSLTGALTAAAKAGNSASFFIDYITMKTALLGIPAAVLFFVITFVINFGIIFLGVRKGIESTAKVLMPILLFLGAALVAKVLTMDGVAAGLDFMWKPDFSKLTEIKVWFDATAQVFFTTSVGIGCILTYASYVKKDQDIALSSLTANATNEFIEVIIGGTIVVPLAVMLLSAEGAKASVTGSAFGLGFITMPDLFLKLGALGPVLQISWFLLLFIGGVTSSVSILQPGISFMEDELSLSKRRSVLLLGAVTLLFTVVIILGMHGGTGADDEIDLWGFQLSLLLFGTIEAILFAWVVGVDKGWEELLHGAEITIPPFYKFVMKYITPTALIVLLSLWLVLDNAKGYNGLDLILMKNYIEQPSTMSDSEFTTHLEQLKETKKIQPVPVKEVTVAGVKTTNRGYILFVRSLLLALLGVVNLIIYRTWKKREA